MQQDNDDYKRTGTYSNRILKKISFFSRSLAIHTLLTAVAIAFLWPVR
jgi:hypothetical protein